MTYAFGPFRLDSNELTLSRDGEVIPLGVKVVMTLLLLVERAGIVVSKRELLDRIWPEGFAEEGSLSQNIYILRKTLRDGVDRDPITTLPKRGYKFVLPVANAETVATTAQPRQSRRFGVAPIVATVALLVVVALIGYVRSHPSSSGFSNPEAARLYALGRLYAEERTRDGVRTSIGDFQRAIELAPQSPLAYAGLADSYLMSLEWCVGKQECDEYSRQARALSAKALQLGPDLAETHSTLAFVATALDNNPANAQREFERAIELNPKYPAVHLWYGSLLFDQHEFGAAETQYEQAALLQPRSPSILTALAADYDYMRRYDDAIGVAKQALVIQPTRSSTLYVLGYALEAKGRYSEAAQTYARIPDASPMKKRLWAARVGARLGERAAAESLLRSPDVAHVSRAITMDLVGPYPSPDATALDVAALYFALGRRDDALEWLRGARGDVRQWLAFNPEFENESI